MFPNVVSCVDLSAYVCTIITLITIIIITVISISSINIYFIIITNNIVKIMILRNNSILRCNCCGDYIYNMIPLDITT